MVRAMITLRPEHRPVDPDFRHTNVCVSYSSRLPGGSRTDMLMIAGNHRGFGAGGATPGALAVAVYDVRSRGALHLVSPRPEEDPVLEEDMLSDESDMARMLDGVRRVARIVAHPAIAGMAERVTFGSTDASMADWLGWDERHQRDGLLAQATDGQHAAGTCRMSAYEDPRGVVDPDLRVKGLDGLRVVDASVMPGDCRANTAFTVMMIAEAGAARFGGGV